ncbi:phage baseplate protein [Anaerofustis stercorihominis]|uniref:phage baseplate protein n=1 Tax=Anaerofustis stercorihominis TaxID=214853 RepID=UPI00214C9802|nr:hypothetical protein [Anaerofustis stercorihominis]MCR2033721.1 hypothetical protein [Anaerofustis stercorihominis]
MQNTTINKGDFNMPIIVTPDFNFTALDINSMSYSHTVTTGIKNQIKCSGSLYCEYMQKTFPPTNATTFNLISSELTMYYVHKDYIDTETNYPDYGSMPSTVAKNVPFTITNVSNPGGKDGEMWNCRFDFKVDTSIICDSPGEYYLLLTATLSGGLGFVTRTQVFQDYPILVNEKTLFNIQQFGAIRDRADRTKMKIQLFGNVKYASESHQALAGDTYVNFELYNSLDVLIDTITLPTLTFSALNATINYDSDYILNSEYGNNDIKIVLKIWNSLDSYTTYVLSVVNVIFDVFDDDINKGIAFGKYVDEEIGGFEVNFPATFYKKLCGQGWLDSTYPIGSIYQTTNGDFDPNLEWGGEWEKIEGRFLLGSSSVYPIGGTGGEASHKLTVAEIPAHIHKPNKSGFYFSINYPLSSDSVARRAFAAGATGRPYAMSGTNVDHITEATATTSVGGNGTHNNMPPYRVVNIWERVS